MPNVIKRFLREWKIERRRRRELATVDLKGDEIVYTRRRRRQRVAWDAIAQIDGGVLALVSGDLLYVVIVAPNLRWEIDEFTEGFAGLETAIHERIPGVREKWLELNRAHAHNDILVTLWKRE
jgi:hypothetical protein